MSHGKISVAIMVTIADSRLELLSNEILLEIFEYLDAYNLCQAFYSLNYRINTLLRSVHLYHLCKSTMQNTDVWNNLPQCFSPSQIRALSIHRSSTFDERHISSNNLNLHLIHFRGANTKDIQTILEHLPDDNQIKSLHLIENIALKGPKRRRSTVIELLLADHGHRFRSLVNLSLLPVRHSHVFRDISVTFPQLRRLSIGNCYWDEQFLQFLLSNTPHLRSLQVSRYSNMLVSNKEIPIPQLRELDITYSGCMSYLRNILGHFPCLYRLHIRWEANDRHSVIKGDLIQKIFEQYLPLLKQFTMSFNKEVDEGRVNTFFTNEYWLKKNLKAKVVVSKAQSRYRLVKTISLGKLWSFQYFDNLQCL